MVGEVMAVLVGDHVELGGVVRLVIDGVATGNHPVLAREVAGKGQRGSAGRRHRRAEVDVACHEVDLEQVHLVAVGKRAEEVGDRLGVGVVAGDRAGGRHVYRHRASSAVIDRIGLRRGCRRGGGPRLRAARTLDHEIADRSGRHRHGKRRRLNLPLCRGSGRRRDQKRGDERAECRRRDSYGRGPGSISLRRGGSEAESGASAPPGRAVIERDRRL